MSDRLSDARERSIRHWRRILVSIGRRRPLAIISELNELSALCEMAGEEAGAEGRRCEHCLVFDDAEQCANARLDISALVINGELDKARDATEAVLRRIRAAHPAEFH